MTYNLTEAVAANLTDRALVERLERLARNPRAFSKEQRAAYLAEAADRILAYSPEASDSTPRMRGGPAMG